MYNGHGDVTTLIKADGSIAGTYYYDAFGNIVESIGTANNYITYAGYQYDKETGLYYLNARMYDPLTARFLQEDTYAGDKNDPLSLNRYVYCLNNPLYYRDITGNYAIGETVYVTGVGNGDSYGTSNPSKNFSNIPMKILNIKSGRAYPYACSQNLNATSVTSTTAWFKDSQISSSPVSTTPTNTGTGGTSTGTGTSQPPAQIDRISPNDTAVYNSNDISAKAQHIYLYDYVDGTMTKKKSYVDDKEAVQVLSKGTDYTRIKYNTFTGTNIRYIRNDNLASYKLPVPQPGPQPVPQPGTQPSQAEQFKNDKNVLVEILRAYGCIIGGPPKYIVDWSELGCTFQLSVQALYHTGNNNSLEITGGGISYYKNIFNQLINLSIGGTFNFSDLSYYSNISVKNGNVTAEISCSSKWYEDTVNISYTFATSYQVDAKVALSCTINRFTKLAASAAIAAAIIFAAPVVAVGSEVAAGTIGAEIVASGTAATVVKIADYIINNKAA